MAAIARGGLYKHPRLFLVNRETSIEHRPSSIEVNLNISPDTLAVLRDGMSAVVNEPDGTAYNQFKHSRFAQQGVNVFGKTGSTEKPAHAWFAGFAEDSSRRAISVAVLVEGGQRGSSDAAPLAREIIQLCIDTAYLGTAQPAPE
jgi:penicillin-binding protein 2